MLEARGRNNVRDVERLAPNAAGLGVRQRRTPPLFDRFATHLAEALDELRKVPVEIKAREFVLKA